MWQSWWTSLSSYRRMIGFACDDVHLTTFPTTISKSKMTNTCEQTIVLVVDDGDILSMDDEALDSITYRELMSTSSRDNAHDYRQGHLCSCMYSSAWYSFHGQSDQNTGHNSSDEKYLTEPDRAWSVAHSRRKRWALRSTLIVITNRKEYEFVHKIWVHNMCEIRFVPVKDVKNVTDFETLAVLIILNEMMIDANDFWSSDTRFGTLSFASKGLDVNIKISYDEFYTKSDYQDTEMIIKITFKDDSPTEKRASAVRFR